MKNDEKKDNFENETGDVKDKSTDGYDRIYASDHDDVEKNTETKDKPIPHKVKVTGLISGEFVTTKKEMKVQEISKEIGADENTIYAMDNKIKNGNEIKTVKETKGFGSTIPIDHDVELKCITLGGES